MRSIIPIISKVITEKATNLEKSKVFVFEVDIKSSKTQIKEAIKILYGETPIEINVVTRPPHARRVGKTKKEVFIQPRKIAYVKMKNSLNKIANT